MGDSKAFGWRCGEGKWNGCGCKVDWLGLSPVYRCEEALAAVL